MEDIDITRSEVLNVDCAIQSLLGSKPGRDYQTISDEEIIINLQFTKPCKIASVAIWAQEDGPRRVDVYCNVPPLDFDNIDEMPISQTLTFEPSPKPIYLDLDYVRFQYVKTLSLFIKDNVTGSETTHLSFLSLRSTAGTNTDVANLKNCSS